MPADAFVRGVTVNSAALLVPETVVTVTSRTVTAAFDVIVAVKLSEVALRTLRFETDMPVPLNATEAPPAFRLVPVSVMFTADPIGPKNGVIAVMVGAGVAVVT